MLTKLGSFTPLFVLLLGYILSGLLDPLTPLIPYIVTAMLFMTFLKVRPRDLSFRPSHLWLLLLQIGLGGLIYLGLSCWRVDIATGMLLCFLTPCATAAPSIVTMLKGDTAYTTSYVLISHFALVILAPLIFPYVRGGEVASGLIYEMWHIFYEVSRLIIPAIVGAWLIVWIKPQLADTLGSKGGIGYSLWLLSLLLLIAHTTIYMETEASIATVDLVIMALLGLITCVGQYAIGHLIAPHLGVERHASRHCIGQKNTSLSIWIAAIFLPPFVGIGITSYIIWQNIIISLVMSHYRK